MSRWNERGRAIFEGEDDAMEAPDQQRMTPQISENATVEQVDLHFVGLVDTEEETVDAKMFHELGESLDVHALGKHDVHGNIFHRHVSRKEPTVLD